MTAVRQSGTTQQSGASFTPTPNLASSGLKKNAR